MDGLQILLGRPDDDLIDVHVGRLSRGGVDGPGHRIGIDGNVGERFYALLYLGHRDMIGQLRLDRAGADFGYPDGAIRLHANAVTEGSRGELGRTVDRRTREDHVAGDRAHIDKLASAMGTHEGLGRGHAVEHALDVDVYHPVPFFETVHLNRGERHDAGVVDPNIQLAIAILSSIDCARHVLVGCHVSLNGDGLVPSGLDLFDKLVQPRLTAGNGDNFRSVLSQQTGGCFANPDAGSGDDDYFSFDTLTHFKSPLWQVSFVS